MRRDLVAASGVWFHGDLAQPVISSANFRQKLTDSGATARTRPNSDYGCEDTASYLYAVSTSDTIIVYYFARNNYCDEHVCVYVCLSATRISPEPRSRSLQNLCACCLWQWLGPLAAG